jgi:hypothetical protein
MLIIQKVKLPTPFTLELAPWKLGTVEVVFPPQTEPVLCGVVKSPILIITPPMFVSVGETRTSALNVKAAFTANVSVALLPSTTTLCPPLIRLTTTEPEIVRLGPHATSVCDPMIYLDVVSAIIGLVDFLSGKWIV